jgi:hypothetical protein
MLAWAAPLTVAGNLADAIRQNRGVSPMAVLDGLGRTGRSLLSASMLTGLMGVLSAFEDRQGTMRARVAGRTASSLIPLSGAARAARRFEDPFVRDPSAESSMWDTAKLNIANTLPFASRGVPTRFDYAGQPIRSTEGDNIVERTMRSVSPFDVRRQKEDPVRNELARLGPDAYLAKPDKTLKDEAGNPMTLNPDQQGELQWHIGRMQYAIAGQVMAAPGYRELPIDEQRQVMEEYMAEARKVAREQFRAYVRKQSSEKP